MELRFSGHLSRPPRFSVARSIPFCRWCSRSCRASASLWQTPCSREWRQLARCYIRRWRQSWEKVRLRLLKSWHRLLIRIFGLSLGQISADEVRDNVIQRAMACQSDQEEAVIQPSPKRSASALDMLLGEDSDNLSSCTSSLVQEQVLQYFTSLRKLFYVQRIRSSGGKTAPVATGSSCCHASSVHPWYICSCWAHLVLLWVDCRQTEGIADPGECWYALCLSLKKFLCKNTMLPSARSRVASQLQSSAVVTVSTATPQPQPDFSLVLDEEEPPLRNFDLNSISGW